MNEIVVNILCRATERSKCKELRDALMRNLLPLASVANLRLEFLITYLPYLPGEEPVELPAIEVLGVKEREKGFTELVVKSYEEALEAISL